MVFLFNSDAERGKIFREVFANEVPHVEFVQGGDDVDPERVKYLLVWTVPEDISKYKNLEVLFSIGAGVDQFGPTIIAPHIKLVRMVEDGIIKMMQEYVTLGVLTLHRNFIDYREQQARQEWQPLTPVQASSRSIGILGLGVLAQAVIERLKPFGFPLSGWSRSRHNIEGVTCYAGQDELSDFLAKTDILICLLPLTEKTRGFLNVSLFKQLPKGAGLVHVGRGSQLDDKALIAALDTGQLSAAILDVTNPEPLPGGDPLWTHPKVMITPHIASVTQPATAAQVVANNIRRHQVGEKMIGLIDQNRGY